MSDLVYVADTDELEAGDKVEVEIDGVSIGVINHRGEYYAIRNKCPHQGGPVCEGLVQDDMQGEWNEPGKRVEYEKTDEPVIACPWHGWEYDLVTGEHLADSSIMIPTYDVVEKNDGIYVQT